MTPLDNLMASRLTLKVRVFAIVCVMVISFVVALSLLSLAGLADLLHEDFRAKGELATNYFARTSVEGIIIEDEISLAETMAQLFEIEDVVYAGIYDSERTLIMREATIETDDLVVLNVSDGNEMEMRTLRMGADGDIRVLDFTVVVLDEQNDRIGWVRTGISLQEIDDKVWDQGLQSLTLTGVFILIALALTFLVANSIANPINALANKAGYIASSRDYSMRAEKRRNDEIGLLVDGFNDMLAQIEQQQTALAENEERFRALVETSSDWIWELDRDTRYTYASPKVKDLLGYEPEEVIGKTPLDLMTAEGAQNIISAFAEMARSKKPVLGLENESLHKNGERVVLGMNTVPILNGDGELVGYRGIDRDITNRKQMEEALEAQRTLDLRTDRLRSLGEMAAGIAHELNQPLTGIRGLAEHFLIGLERGWSFDEEKIRDRSSRIVEQTDRMVHIIEHIRMFAREAGRPETELVQVNEVVQATMVMVGAQFRAHGLNLDIKLAKNLSDVRLNRYSLEEVMLNLLSNARDAVEEMQEKNGPSRDPQIRMSTSMDEDNGSPAVKIEVEDNGVGFPPELMDRVFDPFFTTKDPDKGTGLGLSISRSIVEEFGGAIQIQSNSGEGTTVAVLVPLAGQSDADHPS
jgi:PAS domain S-box-containing protein